MVNDPNFIHACRRKKSHDDSCKLRFIARSSPDRSPSCFDPLFALFSARVFGPGAPAKTGGESFDDIESDGDDENAEESCAQHSTNDNGAERLARDRTGPGSKPERNATHYEGEGGHQNGA